jgi:hypothetical protein
LIGFPWISPYLNVRYISKTYANFKKRTIDSSDEICFVVLLIKEDIMPGLITGFPVGANLFPLVRKVLPFWDLI